MPSTIVGTEDTALNKLIFPHMNLLMEIDKQLPPGNKYIPAVIGAMKENEVSEHRSY